MYCPSGFSSYSELPKKQAVQHIAESPDSSFLAVVTHNDLLIWQCRQTESKLLTQYSRSLEAGPNVLVIWLNSSHLILVAQYGALLHFSLAQSKLVLLSQVKIDEEEILCGCLFEHALLVGGRHLWEISLKANQTLSQPVVLSSTRVLQLQAWAELSCLATVLGGGAACVGRREAFTDVGSEAVDPPDACKLTVLIREGACCLAVNPQEHFVAVGLMNADVNIYHVAAAPAAPCALVARLGDCWSAVPFGIQSSALLGPVSCLQWSPDCSVLAVGWRFQPGVAIWACNGSRLGCTLQDATEFSAEFEGTQALSWTNSGFTLTVAVAVQTSLRKGQTPKSAVIHFPPDSPQMKGEHKSARTPERLQSRTPRNNEGCSMLTTLHFLRSPFRDNIGANVDLALLQPSRLTTWCMVEDEETESPGECWEHLEVPQEYARSNCPLLRCGISRSGKQVALAGACGIVLHNKVSGKWRMFGNVHEEQQVKCGGLWWYGEHILMALNLICKHTPDSHVADAHLPFLNKSASKVKSDQLELLFFPKTHLSASALLHCHRMQCSAPPLAITVEGHMLAILLANGLLLFYAIECQTTAGRYNPLSTQEVSITSLALGLLAVVQTEFLVRPRQFHIWNQRDSTAPISTSDPVPMAVAPPNVHLLGPKVSKSEGGVLCVTCLHLDSSGVLHMLHVRNGDSLGLRAFRVVLDTHVDRLWLAPPEELAISGTHEGFWAQFKLALFESQGSSSGSSGGTSIDGNGSSNGSSNGRSSNGSTGNRSSNGSCSNGSSSNSSSSSSSNSSSSNGTGHGSNGHSTTALKVQLLTFGSAGVYLWVDSAGASSLASHKIMEFDREVWPLGIEWNQGVVVGVAQNSKRHRIELGVDLRCWAVRCKLVLVLPPLLEHFLPRDYTQALGIAKQATGQKYFSVSLELLLHNALLSSPDSLEVAVKLLQEFPTEFPSLVANVARKTEASMWGSLFRLTGSPFDLCLRCIQTGHFQLATCYLLLVQRVSGVAAARELALSLLNRMGVNSDLKLTDEVLRFLLQTSPILREQQVALHPQPTQLPPCHR